jgi:tetratricopeptide (TPR) repeat protein
VNAFYALAQAQTRLGRRDEAAETLKTFQELKKNDMAAMDRDVLEKDDQKTTRDLACSVHMDAAAFYLSRKRWSQAEVHLRRATEINPQDIQSREALASLLHQAGRVQEAVDVYHEVVQLNPRDVDALADLGTMYAVLKQYEPAVANLEKALELKPDMPEALNNLTRLYLSSQKKLPRALEMAERLAAQYPSATNFDLLAWAYFANGRLEEALEACAASIRLDPTNPRYQSRYAKLRSFQ